MKTLLLMAVRSKVLLYLVMALPGWELFWALISGDRYHAEMMYVSGVYSVYLLVLTLAVTPISLLAARFPSTLPVAQWLVERRRDFGLGSFGYAAMHAVHYLVETGDLVEVAYQATDFDLAVGWLGLLVLIVLAATSNQAACRALGRNWKRLHRLIYAGAMLIVLHWLLFAFRPHEVISWAIVLVAVKVVHAGFYFARRRVRKSRPATV